MSSNTCRCCCACRLACRCGCTKPTATPPP